MRHLRSIFYSLLLFSSSSCLAAARDVVTEVAFMAGVQIDGARPWDVQVYHEVFFPLVLRDRTLGIGETYMAGLWECGALDECTFRMERARMSYSGGVTYRLGLLALQAKIFAASSSGRGYEFPIESNFFQDMPVGIPSDHLASWQGSFTYSDAEKAGMDRLAKSLALSSGMRVAILGSSSALLATYLTKEHKVEAVNLPLPATLSLTGKFDRIVMPSLLNPYSQGLSREFLASANASLKEGGLLLLYVSNGGGHSNFRKKYLGGYGELPTGSSADSLRQGLFSVYAFHNVSLDYDQTLIAWSQNFDLVKERYSPATQRMWRYYLLSTAGYVRAGSYQLYELILTKI